MPRDMHAIDDDLQHVVEHVVRSSAAQVSSAPGAINRLRAVVHKELKHNRLSLWQLDYSSLTQCFVVLTDGTAQTELYYPAWWPEPWL
mgnify:CR=1 FL=1